uniref:Transmembrane protein n=1 Tax=Medicago truncatula TaxID=3880 RepID=I3S7R2_MEDTR|nr:unknown [Medicago truncatula]
MMILPGVVIGLQCSLVRCAHISFPSQQELSFEAILCSPSLANLLKGSSPSHSSLHLHTVPPHFEVDPMCGGTEIFSDLS